MWFKNLRVYRLTKPFDMSSEQLAEKLEEYAFTPCGSQDESRYGWVSPLGSKGKSMVQVANGCLMICGKKQQKVLPTAVVNEIADEQISEIQDKEDRRVGRKERADIKDQLRFELMPRAFARSTLQFAYIAPRDGWIVIDAASTGRAEDLLVALREAIGSLPVVPLTCKNLPTQQMTQSLIESVAPEGFEFGHECELKDPKDTQSVIRAKNQDLASAEIKAHLDAGMFASKLGLNWLGGIEFMIDDELSIKRLRYADEINERADEQNAEDTATQFDVEFSVMNVELAGLIRTLTKAFGGVDESDVSVEEIMLTADKDSETFTGVDEVEF